MKRTIILIATAMLCSSAYPDTLIYAGQLIDGDSGKPRSNVTIVIRGNTIERIDNGFSNPSDTDTVIDLRNHAVLPGFMDMHTHLTGEYSKDARLKPFIRNEADYAFDAARHAKSTLEAGFTVVRNLGDAFNVTVALRKAINDGDVVGPRIFSAAKTLASTGGHGDPTNGWAAHLNADPGPKQGVVNSIADARKAVRQRYKDGADWIKITATGGVLSVAKNGQNPQFTVEELRAIVDTAADYELRVAAHAHGKEGMKRAIIAGVASIEHGTYMDKEIMALMKKNNTYYVPTILAGDWVAEKAAIDGFFPDLVRPKAATIGPRLKETFAAAYAYGVPIVFGTDSGVSAHGENAKEFALMVGAGMSPMEAIQSATSVAAEFLGISDTHGSIASGKQADIVAVPGDPLQNIDLLQQVSFVMKAGTIYKQ